jgi:pimeloyl-ACP methyl ester carboxylesterase
MDLIQTHGITLSTQSFGDQKDPALVLIMGATASMLGWPDALCEGLAARGLFVLRFDHRDTGRSTTRPPGLPAYAVEDLADDMVAILDVHDRKSAHLMGMSLGGYIAQMVAVDHPGRVRSLTLIASEPLGWEGEALPQIAPGFLEHFAVLSGLDWSDRRAVEDFLVGTDRLCAGAGTPFDEAAARARAAAVLDRTNSPASMFNHAALSVRRDWSGAVGRIGCPTLVIHGTDDPILPLPNGRAIAATIPGADLMVLDGVGHDLPPTRLEEIAARVARHVHAAEAGA